MKRWLGWAALGLAAAALVALSGVIPIRASSGHWAITAWILDLIKRRSVAVWSMGTEPQPLQSPALRKLGAAYFDVGCRSCHGRPGETLPAIPARMTPHPPDLSRQVARWKPRELFYIVKHGIKFTGMPAWPAPPRDDDVWAVVAFLTELPNIDGTRYAALIGGGRWPPSGDSELDRTLTQCQPCHALPAHEREAAGIPGLEGQRPAYLEASLAAYATGRRHSGIMSPIAARLDDGMRARLATYFASASPPFGEKSSPGPSESTLITRGDPSRDVPPCVECHGPGPGEREPHYPALAGQPAQYLRRQLELFAEGRRGGTPHADIMRPIAGRLTAEQRQEAAAAFAELRLSTLRSSSSGPSGSGPAAER